MTATEGHRPAINRVMRHIADHLAEPMTVAGLARVAHLSPFHFHRVFAAEVGEPVGRFVTRRRLEVAALGLAYHPHRSITEIALSSGYGTSSSFSKAFGAYFGCTPTAVRAGAPVRAIGELTRRHGKDFCPLDLYVLPPALDAADRRRIADGLAVRFETSAGARLACLAGPNGYPLAGLEETWRTLIGWARQLGIADEAVDAWGIVHDSPALTAPERLRYHAAVPCPDDRPLPAPLTPGRLPAGRYAVFAYDGPVDGVEAHYRRIYACWFAESLLQPEDFVPFDHYVGDAPRDGRVRMEMWIRVTPR